MFLLNLFQSFVSVRAGINCIELRFLKIELEEFRKIHFIVNNQDVFWAVHFPIRSFHLIEV